MRLQAKVVAAVVALLASTQATADIVLIAPNADASIYAESGGLSNGAGQGLFTGQTNDGFVRRALVSFDVAGSVPAGATVNSASLHLYATQSNTGALTTNLHRLLFGFNEGTVLAPGNGGTGAPANPGDSTWTHRVFNTTPWAMPGADFDASASASLAVGAAFQSYTWTSPELAADVQSMLDDPSQNFGWVILAQTTGSGQAKRFASREYPDAMLQPTLEVDFESSLPTGACCLPDGNCSTVLDPPGASCSGSYQGNGTACDTTACPQPTGACCIADASATCLSVTAAQCDAQMGMFQGAFVGCASDLCPVVPTPFVDALPIPAVAQPLTGSPGGEASYQVAFVEFDQVLHSELPPTTVWGFNDGSTGNRYPGPTFEAAVGQQVTVDWLNDLRDENGAYLSQHHLPVDACPHGASDNQAFAVMHLHGAHVQAAFDGHPELRMVPGESAVYEYPNEQNAATLWYHDHSLGMTRLGVEMGLAGAYIVRDPAEAALGLPAGQYEIPMIIQDRSFNPDGSFKYPADFTEHVVGNTILVNGRVWPYLNVDRGKYRFRWVNGSGSRAYRLQLSDGATFQQIGTDGGLLTAPLPMTELLIMPGERADVVIDFGAYAPGTVVDLINDAPTPYPGTMSMDDVPNVMRFNVGAAAGHIAPVPAALGTVLAEPTTGVVREFTLAREADACTGGRWVIRNAATGGTDFDDVDVSVPLGATEIWSFANASGLSHPMHMHLVQFRVLDRQPFVLIDGNISTTGPPVPASGADLGYKDTVRVDPNEIVRVTATFKNYVGDYVYHCHILEHEDNEMMRQFEIVTVCGDGQVGFPGEECDDGNYDPNDACPDGSIGTCKPAVCGDGLLYGPDSGGPEECDAMGEGMYCNSDCTNSVCGDDKLNVTAGEACDDGNLKSGDGCDQNCLEEAPVGGNGAGAGEPSGGASGSGANGSGAESGVGGAGNGADNAGGGGGDDPGGRGCNCRTAAGDQRGGGLFWLAALGLTALGARATSRRRRFENHP